MSVAYVRSLGSRKEMVLICASSGQPNKSFYPTLGSESLIIKMSDFCYLGCRALASGG